MFSDHGPKLSGKRVRGLFENIVRRHAIGALWTEIEDDLFGFHVVAQMYSSIRLPSDFDSGRQVLFLVVFWRVPELTCT